MVNWATLRVFLATWRVKLWDRLLAFLTLVTLVITLVGFFGLTAASVPRANLAFLLVPAYLVWVGYKTVPQFYLTPSAIVGRRLEMAELDKLLVKVFTVGLVGITDAGKTTFLDAVRHRKEPKRRTAAPYAVIVVLPDRNQTKYIAIVDSVGQLFDNQFDVVRHSDLVCLFLDHNTSDTLPKSNSSRLNKQREFVDQIARTHEYETLGARSILLLGNKSDLWSGTQATSVAMGKLLNHCENRLSVGAGFQKVRRIDQFSNRMPDNIAQAMQEIGNAVDGKF